MNQKARHTIIQSHNQDDRDLSAQVNEVLPTLAAKSRKRIKRYMSSTTHHGITICICGNNKTKKAIRCKECHDKAAAKIRHEAKEAGKRSRGLFNVQNGYEAEVRRPHPQRVGRQGLVGYQPPQPERRAIFREGKWFADEESYLKVVKERAWEAQEDEAVKRLTAWRREI